MTLKDLFPGYRSPKNDQIASWWQDGLFVLDTNVILDFYRYSSSTRDELLGILNKLSDRIWIPNQAAFEFMKNRPDVILTQIGMYDKTKTIISELENIAKDEVRKNLTFQHHPFIDKDKLLSKLHTSFEELNKELDHQKSSHPDLLNDDPIFDLISKLFGENIGEPYSPDQLKELYKIAEKRYAERIPPGYMDAEGQQKKEGDKKYGDFILWSQIIEKAKNKAKPIILITNDNKEDWWWSTKGKTIGPRPELISEIFVEAKVNFYMYKTDRFMNFARQYLDFQIRQDAIDEIRDVRLQKEDENRSTEGIAPFESEIFDVVKNKLREISQYIKQGNPSVAALFNAARLYGVRDHTIIFSYTSDILHEKAVRSISLIDDAIKTITGMSIDVEFVIVAARKPNQLLAWDS